MFAFAIRWCLIEIWARASEGIKEWIYMRGEDGCVRGIRIQLGGWRGPASEHLILDQVLTRDFV